MNKNTAIIVATVVLIVSMVAFYSQMTQFSNPISPLKVGDSFTYHLTGISTSQNPVIQSPMGYSLSMYNQTDYWKFTITTVSGRTVSYNWVWRYINGTEKKGTDTVDLLSGKETAPMGFWLVYAPKLEVGDLLFPTGSYRYTVNQTDSRTYTDTTRESNFWFQKDNDFDLGFYFDKQTGVLESLNCTVSYNNPKSVETLIWKLVNTNVWAV